VHVDNLAITLRARHNGRDHDQLAVRHKVADASLLAALGFEFEFQRGAESDQEQKRQESEDGLRI
jgi:hypothetical protein